MIGLGTEEQYEFLLPQAGDGIVEYVVYNEKARKVGWICSIYCSHNMNSHFYTYLILV